MSISANSATMLATHVSFTKTAICVQLSDGRKVETPLSFYPRLAKASFKELNNYRFIGKGLGIHWEDLDEDLSVESIVLGKQATLPTS